MTNPGIWQRIASGYNRLLQTSHEGGIQEKEYNAIYNADRVRNVSAVWMGATIGCAQCHDHKYDPYTSRDFYSLGAFFADIQELGVYSARKREPVISVPSPIQQEKLAELNSQLSRLRSNVVSLGEKVLRETPDWEAVLKQQTPLDSDHVWLDDRYEVDANTSGVWQFVAAEQGPVKSGKFSRRQNAKGLDQHYVINAKKKYRNIKMPDGKIVELQYVEPSTAERFVRRAQAAK